MAKERNSWHMAERLNVLSASLRRSWGTGLREEGGLLRRRTVGAGRIEEAKRSKRTGGPGRGLGMWGLSRWL